MNGDGRGNGPTKKIPGSITTVHRYELPLPREEVWSLISDVSQVPQLVAVAAGVRRRRAGPGRGVAL